MLDASVLEVYAPGDEVHKDVVDLLLLAAVRRRPLHGYALVEELRRFSDGEFDLAEGTLYPALRRLEHAGLLTSRWSTAGGRPRRVYRLTRAGRHALDEREAAWRRFATAVDVVLEPGG